MNMFYLSFVFSCIIIVCAGLPYFDIPVKGDSQNGYFVTVLVGTPSQHLNFLIDTGSSNVAVAAVAQKMPTTKYFAFNDSHTFHSSSEEIHLRYVQGDWKGFIGTDVFNPCTASFCSIYCNISCMTSMKDIFDKNSQFQGILGLAYTSISKPNPSFHSFLDVFISVQKIKNVFSLDLCGPFFSHDVPSDSCGNFRIGLNKKDTYKNIMFTPIVHEWYYEITVVDLKVGLQSAPLKCNEINKDKSIIDSGTTELAVPAVIYEFIVSEIHKHPEIASFKDFSKNDSLFCLQNKPIDASMFPNIVLTLYHSKNSTFDIHVSPELYLLPVVNSTKNCAKLGIGTSSFGIVIGSSILKGFHVLFDRENRQIGFAEPHNRPSSQFISAVSNALIYDTDFDHCIRSDNISDDSAISPFVIFLLIVICIIAVLFLYALLSWIWKIHILGHDNISDTSSLIADDD